MNIVRTTSRNYICNNAIKTEGSITLDGALCFEGNPDPRKLAQDYLAEYLSGTLKSYTIGTTALESIEQDAGDVGPMIEALVAFAPLAQRRVLARATVKEVVETFAFTSNPKG